ncbi:MAG: right-handed parallel beta-helix repeat-containing protein [Verrucomicrobiota bacterium JB024]|nr:right-handed parallel beta-helix repeat-containing protein [Verrucomicrobiota bacterium JB024]
MSIYTHRFIRKIFATGLLSLSVIAPLAAADGPEVPRIGNTLTGVLPAIAPAAGERLFMPFPEFRWQALPDANEKLSALVEYEIQISTDILFSQLTDQDCVALARYVPSQSLAPASYFWRVRATKSGKAISSWSDTYALTVTAPDEQIVVERQVGASDDSAAVEEAVSQARKLTASGKTVELVFPAGTYVGSNQRNGTFLNLKGIENLIITGNGSLINLATYDTSFSRIEDCRNVLIQGFEVNIPDELPQTQGRVVSVNPASASIVVEFENGYPNFEDAYIRDGDGTLRLIDSKIDGRLKSGVGTWFHFDGDRREHLGGSKYRMYMKMPSYRTEKGVVVVSKDLSDLVKDFEPGDRFIYSLTSTGSAVSFAKNSVRITYHDITDYASVRHYWALYCSEMHYIRTRSILSEGRWFNGHSDGIHVRGSEIGPWIEEAEINGIGDDGVALYSRPNRLVPQSSVSGTRELMFFRDNYFDLEPGNAATLYRPTTGEILFESIVVSVEELPGKKARVTFADEIDSDPLFNEEWTLADQVWNRSKSCGDFAVRNCALQNIRRYGTIFRARNGLIENNRYEGVSAAAIIYLNEPQYPNGLYASNIVIRGNTIIDCAFDRMPTRVITFMFKRLGGGEAAESMGPRHILIEDNTIDDCGREPLEFWSTRDVLLRNNTVDGEPLGNMPSHLQRNCARIVFADSE